MLIANLLNYYLPIHLGAITHRLMAEQGCQWRVIENTKQLSMQDSLIYVQNLLDMIRG